MGRPLKEINVNEILSKYSFNSSTKSIESLFKEAREIDGIVVFDQAEGLFSSQVQSPFSDSTCNALIYYMNHFPGIVILKTTDLSRFHLPSLPSLRFILEFKRPDVTLRTQLWRKLLPDKTPKQ